MSLRIWFPFDGAIKNKGLQSISLTNNGAVVDDNGKIGKCYSFDGSTQYMIATNVPISKSTWTIAAWIYPSIHSEGSSRYIAGFNTSTANDFAYGLCLAANKLAVRIASTDYKVSENYVQNIWYHLTAVYDNGTLRLYLNGALDLTTSAVTPLDASTLYVGVRGGMARWFTGKINDLRIYDHALSALEVKEISMGLVRHYKFDNFITGNDTICDSSGYSHPGIKSGGVTISNTSPVRYDQNVVFDGTDDMIECDPLPAETATISVWMKTSFVTSSNNKIAIYDKQSALAMGWSSTGFISYVGSSAGGTGSRIKLSSTNYTADKWNHIVVVKTGDTTRDVYVNGVLATDVSASYFLGDQMKLNFGCRHASNSYMNYFGGELSDFRAYVTQLTANDVLRLYKTAASVAKNGAMLGYEFKEVT